MRAALALALLLGGCGDADFPSRGLLEGYRVVALGATPPEVAPDGVLRLFVVEYDPATLGVEQPGSVGAYYVWSLCPFSLGATARYACVDPRLEVGRRTRTPTLTVDLGPDGLDLDAWLERARPIVGDAAVEAARSDGLTLTVRLVSGRAGVGPEESVRTVRVRDTDTPNRNPVVQSIDVDAPTIAGTTIDLEVSLGGLAAQALRQPDGTYRPERLWSAWYTTGGELTAPTDADGVRPTYLRLPDRPGPLRVYVVVRDERGGASALWRDLIVTAPP